MEPAEPLKSSPRVVGMGMAVKPPVPHLWDHLANERTYLAYLRTSIALIGFGVTINRFSTYLVQSKTLPERALSRWNLGGVSSVASAWLSLASASWLRQPFTSRKSTVGSNMEPTGRASILPWIITAVVLLGGGLSLMWIFPH